MGDFPELIVLAELTQINQVEFIDALPEFLSQIDFQKSLVLFVLRNNLPDSGTVQEVIKGDRKVWIVTREIDPGPGDYALREYSPPYQIIKIAKSEAWNGRYDFILERVSGELVSKVSVFVP